MSSLNNINVKTPQDTGILIQAVFDESDRGFVIAATAFIEKQMDVILGPKLSNKLTTFSTKTEVISELFLEHNVVQIIKALTKIRNEAAHSYKKFCLNNDDPSFKTNVIKKTRQLTLHQQVSTFEINFNINTSIVITKEKVTVMEFAKKLEGTKLEPRMNLFIATVVIATYLKAIGEHPIMQLKTYKLKFN